MSDPLSKPSSAPHHGDRIEVLDGWRAISILLVLVGHWLPMPHQLQANYMAAASGMALFFALSGFLITSLLLRDPQPAPFFVRRLFRIVPLAWGAMAILVIANGADMREVLGNFLFYANLPPASLMHGGQHLWSLCVEVQFYVFAALLVAALGRRGVWLLPLCCLAVTGLRVADQETLSIVTWHRVDEILSGATVALLLAWRRARGSAFTVPGWACLVAVAMLLASAHPATGPLQYLRPYFAAATICCSILATPDWLRVWLTGRAAKYVAEVSYAVYVIHGMLTVTWLGGEQASKTVRYALRPVLVAATFALAHLSTFHFERHFIRWGKALARKVSRPAATAHSGPADVAAVTGETPNSHRSKAP